MHVVTPHGCRAQRALFAEGGDVSEQQKGVVTEEDGADDDRQTVKGALKPDHAADGGDHGHGHQGQIGAFLGQHHQHLPDNPRYQPDLPLIERPDRQFRLGQLGHHVVTPDDVNDDAGDDHRRHRFGEVPEPDVRVAQPGQQNGPDHQGEKNDCRLLEVDQDQHHQPDLEGQPEGLVPVAPPERVEHEPAENAPESDGDGGGGVRVGRQRDLLGKGRIEKRRRESAQGQQSPPRRGRLGFFVHALANQSYGRQTERQQQENIDQRAGVFDQTPGQPAGQVRNQVPAIGIGGKRPSQMLVGIVGENIDVEEQPGANQPVGKFIPLRADHGRHQQQKRQGENGDFEGTRGKNPVPAGDQDGAGKKGQEPQPRRQGREGNGGKDADDGEHQADQGPTVERRGLLETVAAGHQGAERRQRQPHRGDGKERNDLARVFKEVAEITIHGVSGYSLGIFRKAFMRE